MAESVRAFWKGSLRLSLVFIPVKLVSAVRTEGEVHLHQVDRKTQQRIRYQKVNSAGKVVDKSDIVSGYQVDGGYVLFEGEEIDAVKLKSRHTIELTQFVDHCEIDPLYFERPYFLLPDGDAANEGYCVIRNALREAKKVGIGQLTIRGREDLVALEPAGDGLVLNTLRYDEEIKDQDSVFSEVENVKARKDLVDMALQLIEGKTGEFNPASFKNHYAQALRDLVKEKVKTGKVVEVEGGDEERPANVVDFMDALKRSLKQSGEGAKSGSRSAPKSDSKPSSKSAPSKKPAKKASTKRSAAKTANTTSRVRSAR